MASSALRKELSCPICKNFYTEPVSLTCGHTFCQQCIVTALDMQKGSGDVYSCPECREEYPECPPQEKNLKLSNVVEHLRSMYRECQETEICCTYCVDSTITAVKTCVRCETSMCDKHLDAHNKAVDHVLLEPTSSFYLSSKICFTHKKPLEFYCLEDAAWLCASCCPLAKHEGHKVEPLEEASEEKKEKMRGVLKILTPKKGEIEEQIQSLQEHKINAQEKIDYEKKRVIAMYEDLKRQFEVQKEAVLSELSRGEEQISQSVSEQIQQLEKQRDQLSKKMAVLEKLCKMTNPISILQCPESDLEDKETIKPTFYSVDSVLISLMLHSFKTENLTKIKAQITFNTQIARDLHLDVKTAHNFVVVSDDLKTASSSEESQNRREIPERFKNYPQVMTVEKFDNKRHYWEVEIGDYGDWAVGMAYTSVGREGKESCFGCNKSWMFRRCGAEYSARHGEEEKEVYSVSVCNKIGVYLDFEARRLSFYQLGGISRQLYTFKATFTEPLHIAFYVAERAWIKLTR
ncbi:E3 ubiquitin-protein ligase TRIM39-like [Hyperolius riggenbachi]|uniref:E3 ubiquitin-protein ligase TRIM39-like n=1 Tax=Hyperolius riggenbachi TaxID=752182 RepID=UPI0035A3D59F